jgi:hydroxyacylglutathione hydrolase
VDKESQEALVVDPVDPETILAEVKEQNVTLKGVLTTHHHWFVKKRLQITDLYNIFLSFRDHAGGNVQLVKLYEAENNNKLVIYGGDQRIGALTEKV